MWEGSTGHASSPLPASERHGSFSAAGWPERATQGPRSFVRSLYLFGWGDGGGGPEPDMIESARRLSHLAGGPDIELSRAADFFAASSRESHDLTTWVGELYFELHRGTYTSQSRTKRLNRRAEQALRKPRCVGPIGDGYPAESLTPPGSGCSEPVSRHPSGSADCVYEDAERDLRGGETAAGSLYRRRELAGLSLAFLSSRPAHPSAKLRLEVEFRWSRLRMRLVRPRNIGGEQTSPLERRWRTTAGVMWMSVAVDSSGTRAGREVLSPAARAISAAFRRQPLALGRWDSTADYAKHGATCRTVAAGGGVRGRAPRSASPRVWRSRFCADGPCAGRAASI